MKFLAFLMALSCFVSVTQAYDKVRNGGIVVQCGDKLEPLDTFEAKILNPYYQLHKPIAGDVWSMMEKMLLRLRPVDPVRVDTFVRYIQEFQWDYRLLPEDQVGPTNDLGSYPSIPAGCKTVQGVAQLLDASKDDTRYLISRDVWSRLSTIHKATLMMHEFVYRDIFMLKRKVRNSMQVRQCTAFLVSEKITNISKKEYAEAITQCGLSYIQFPSDEPKQVPF